MTLYNVGDVVFLNVTSGISPDPDWQIGVVTRATNSYGWTAATTFPDQNVIKVELFVGPVWRQLADAPLHSGLADAFWSGHFCCQNRAVLTDVVQNVGHHSGGACEGHCWRCWC